MPTTTHKCPACKGSGKQVIKSVHVNFDGKGGRKTDKTEINCVFCNGEGSVDDGQLAMIKAMNEAWCTCGNPSGKVVPYNYPNGSHGYDCADCGKLLQTG